MDLVRGSSGRALRFARLGDVRTGLVVVDVEVGCFLMGGELIEVSQTFGDRLRTTHAIHPGPERLAGVTLVGEPPHDADCGLGRVLRGQTQRLLTELDLCLTDV